MEIFKVLYMNINHLQWTQIPVIRVQGKIITKPQNFLKKKKKEREKIPHESWSLLA